MLLNFLFLQNAFDGDFYEQEEDEKPQFSDLEDDGDGGQMLLDIKYQYFLLIRSNLARLC